MRSSMMFAVAALLFGMAGNAAERGLEIYWCDVEGGAATLIVTPAGESLLVDSGWPGERDPERIAMLAREVAGLKHIDHYLTTHWHTDHFGGIGRLAELVPIKNFYDHGFPELPRSDIPADLVDAYKRASRGKSTALKAGEEIRLKQASGSPRVALKILASHGAVLGESGDAPQVRPCDADPGHEPKPVDASDNARSLTFLLSFGDWQFFDAGDLTWNVEHKLVCPRNLVGSVDVYQVTHHGLDTSNNPAILKALRPRVAVMNNGARKAGNPAAVRAVKSSPGLQGFFALHRNVQTGPDDNAAPADVANDEEQCAGEHIRLTVAPDSKSYTVRVPSKQTAKTFATEK